MDKEIKQAGLYEAPYLAAISLKVKTSILNSSTFENSIESFGEEETL